MRMERGIQPSRPNCNVRTGLRSTETAQPSGVTDLREGRKSVGPVWGVLGQPDWVTDRRLRSAVQVVADVGVAAGRVVPQTAVERKRMIKLVDPLAGIIDGGWVVSGNRRRRCDAG
jgi:hypothetical protein